MWLCKLVPISQWLPANHWRAILLQLEYRKCCCSQQRKLIENIMFLPGIVPGHTAWLSIFNPRRLTSRFSVNQICYGAGNSMARAGETTSSWESCLLWVLCLPWSNGLATLCCGSFIGSGDSPVLGAGGMSGTASEPQSGVWAAKGQVLYGQREPP